MPSAAERARDPGLAGERTALAWQRMAMGFTSLAALTLGVAAHRHAPAMVVPAAALFAVALVLWRYARRRGTQPSRHARARELAWLSLATVLAAVLAAVLALVRPG